MAVKTERVEREGERVYSICVIYYIIQLDVKLQTDYNVFWLDSMFCLFSVFSNRLIPEIMK